MKRQPKKASPAKAAPPKAERWIVNGKAARGARESLEKAQREAEKIGRTTRDLEPDSSAKSKRAPAKPRRRAK